jgi:dihydropteroate synthase
VLAFERGASVFRVHDVAPVREALTVAAATLGGGWTARSTQTTPTS